MVYTSVALEDNDDDGGGEFTLSGFERGWIG